LELLARAARQARRQHGLLTHQQALALGFTPDRIRTLLARGAWREIRRGVYVVGGVPPSWEQTLRAITLPFDDCWITHGTAAKLRDLRHAPQVGRIEALRPYGKSTRLDGVTLRRSRIIVAADVTSVRGIPVTSAARTIVECSGRLDPKRTGQLIDDVMRGNPIALELVRACYARLAGGGRRRLQSIRAALGARLPGYDPGESDLEIDTLREIMAAGLPIPVQQHRLVLNGQRRRIDLAYVTEKIAIELMGWDPHRGREAFDDDKARTGELVADGWRVLEVTSRHAPADYLRWITGALAHATAA
jgi:hypothetical protein